MSLQHTLSRFLLSFAEALSLNDAWEARTYAAHLLRLAGSLDTHLRIGSPARIPVQAVCEASLRKEATTSTLAESLLELMPYLHLTRSENYAARPPSPDFAERYGYGVVCGSAGGPPSLLTDPEIAFGVLLLAPNTFYPLHHHPADELYYVVSGASRWWRGTGPWAIKRSGDAIHHPSWIPHATEAGDSPLAALYIWQGDLETDAVFLSQYAEPSPDRYLSETRAR